MFRKKAVLFLILLTILAGLLAACGDTPTSTSAPVATSTTVVATTSAPPTTVAVITAAPTTSAPTTVAATTAPVTTAARVTTAPATTPAATTSAPTAGSTINKALPLGIEYVKGYYDLTAPAGLKERLAKSFGLIIGKPEVNIYATKSDSFFTDTFHRTSLTKAGWKENTTAFKAAGSEKLLGGSSQMQAHTKDGKQVAVFLLDDFSNLTTMEKLGFKNVQSYHTVVILITGDATNLPILN
jgi:hypothetical protein